MRPSADYRDRCRIAAEESKKLIWRIQQFLDESRKVPPKDWNVHNYHRLTASIRRQSMELSQVLVDLRKPL